VRAALAQDFRYGECSLTRFLDTALRHGHHAPAHVEKKALIIVMAAAVGLGLLALGLHQYPRKDEQGFVRDDSALIANDDMGLTHAYKTLRESGRRVAFSLKADEPAAAYSWWIVRPTIVWFTAEHAQQVRMFVENGGVAVLAPEETVIQLGAAETHAELEAFFKVLDLDLQIVAFDPPDEESDENEDALPDEGVPASITLPVSGSGERFLSLDEIQTSWGNYFDGESLLKAEIRVHTDGFPLVAEFTLGKGRLVLVAESTYFENEFLDRSQNRSLLLALADAYGSSGIVMHHPSDDADQR
jgi:hypothetical protein